MEACCFLHVARQRAQEAAVLRRFRPLDVQGLGVVQGARLPIPSTSPAWLLGEAQEAVGNGEGEPRGESKEKSCSGKRGGSGDALSPALCRV